MARRGRPDVVLLLCGLALVGVATWVLATRWGAVLAGHPAYLVTLLGAAGVGALLLLVGLRRGRTR